MTTTVFGRELTYDRSLTLAVASRKWVEIGVRRDLFPKPNPVLLCEVAEGYFATKHKPAFLADLTLL